MSFGKLYEGESSLAHRFRYGLVAFDIATVVLLIVSSFLKHTKHIAALDVVIVLLVRIAASFAMRPMPSIASNVYGSQ